MHSPNDRKISRGNKSELGFTHHFNWNRTLKSNPINYEVEKLIGFFSTQHQF